MKLSMTAAMRYVIALTLGAVVLIGGLGAYVVSKHAWAQDKLAQLEPRYARLLGLEASAASLDATLAQRKTLLARHAYLSSQDVARAGSDGLQRAREVFAKAGLDVSSTQVLPAKPIEGFDRIPMVLRLEGELPALQSALVVLPAQTPTLFIEGFNVQTVGVPKAEAQRLSMQVNLFVLRVRP